MESKQIQQTKFPQTFHSQPPSPGREQLEPIEGDAPPAKPSSLQGSFKELCLCYYLFFNIKKIKINKEKKMTPGEHREKEMRD